MDKLRGLFIRYLLIILVALPNLFIFYLIFTPLTIYPLLGLFKLFFKEVILTNSTLIISGQFNLEIIKACIAGSAYYLLFILNLSIPNISLKKRLKMISFSFLILLILNIVRILILGLIFVSNKSSFESIHQVFWYSGATLFVVLIWFAEVKIFKIKRIPIYSDIKYILKKINSSKSSKSN